MTETTHVDNTHPAQPSAHEYDLAIVGAGIVGLATAREALLRRPGLRVVVLEKAATIASEQSSHNSGVIHSGIYYAPGSLKARACVAGHRAMLEFCREQAIPFELCGKVIVALDDSELPRIEELYQRGLANGVEGLEMIGPERLRELEPYAAGIKAIYSPNTGIIDYKLVAQAYARAIQQSGGEIITSCQVTSLTTSGNHTIIGARQHPKSDLASPFRVGAPLACAPAPTRNGEARTWLARARPSHAHIEIQARYVITCGGLHADTLSKMSREHSAVQIVPFRGDYYLLRPQKRHMVRSLIYPVPDPRFPFLGVHFTRRPDGEVWAGPNAVLAFARNGYRRWQINPRDLWEVLSYRGSWKMAARYWRMGLIEMYRDYVKAAYVRVLQRYLPELQGRDLLPGPSGVRAQAMTPDGRLVDDFLIQHGEHVIHVQNAPSPAATSSLYIARMIVDEAARSFDIFAGR